MWTLDHEEIYIPCRHQGAANLGTGSSSRASLSASHCCPTAATAGGCMTCTEKNGALSWVLLLRREPTEPSGTQMGIRKHGATLQPLIQEVEGGNQPELITQGGYWGRSCWQIFP